MLVVYSCSSMIVWTAFDAQRRQPNPVRRSLYNRTEEYWPVTISRPLLLRAHERVESESNVRSRAVSFLGPAGGSFTVSRNMERVTSSIRLEPPYGQKHEPTAVKVENDLATRCPGERICSRLLPSLFTPSECGIDFRNDGASV